MAPRAPWFQRHPYAFVGVLVLGFFVAVGAVDVVALSAQVPGARLLSMAAAFAWLLGVPRLAALFLRRSLREYDEDPNVLWSATVQLDKLDLLRAGLGPVPQKDAPAPAIFLLTRTGVSFRAFEGGPSWAGLDLAEARIGAVSRGHAMIGKRRVPALNVLVGEAVITLPILSGAGGLDEALARSPLTGRVCSADEFLDRQIDAEYGEDPDGNDTDSNDTASTHTGGEDADINHAGGESGVEGHDDAALEDQYERTYRNIYWRYLGRWLAAYGGVLAAFAIGVACKWSVLVDAALLALFGSTVWFAITQWRDDRAARRERQGRIRELEGEQARRR